MTHAAVPELHVDPAIAEWVATRCAAEGALASLEQGAITGEIQDRILESSTWRDFSLQVQELWRNNDHLVLRGAPTSDDGASLLLLARVVGRRFKTYRGGQIVKQFRMSPWTTDLSHTLQEGHFHTDVNTTGKPPLVTAIQCRIPDPGAPLYGEVRVARLPDLLRALHVAGDVRTLAFLKDTDVTMVNQRAKDAWTGRIVADDSIRFHPETLRDAETRYGNPKGDLEQHLAAIKSAALAVSTPIQLDAGDTLFVSNARALHYRGVCSVTYHSFPRGFVSREIYVLHLLDEPV